MLPFPHERRALPAQADAALWLMFLVSLPCAASCRDAPAAEAIANVVVPQVPQVHVTASAPPTETTEQTGSYTVAAFRGATGLKLTLRDTPQSVSVMTHARIEDQQLNDISAVVTQVPGISARPQDSERVAFYARGFVIDNVLYDGVRTYPGSYANHGKTQSDMAIFDRVEVIRGATGLMSGTGSPGASINLIRKKPTAIFQGSTSASAGTWGRYRADIDLSGPLNAAGTVRGRLVGAQSDGDSFLNNYHKRRAVGYGIDCWNTMRWQQMHVAPPACSCARFRSVGSRYSVRRCGELRWPGQHWTAICRTAPRNG